MVISQFGFVGCFYSNIFRLCLGFKSFTTVLPYLSHVSLVSSRGSRWLEKHSHGTRHQVTANFFGADVQPDCFMVEAT